MKLLNLKNKDEFIIFYTRINKSWSWIFTKKKTIRLSVHINMIISNFCNQITKYKKQQKK